MKYFKNLFEVKSIKEYCLLLNLIILLIEGHRIYKKNTFN